MFYVQRVQKSNEVLKSSEIEKILVASETSYGMTRAAKRMIMWKAKFADSLYREMNNPLFKDVRREDDRRW